MAWADDIAQGSGGRAPDGAATGVPGLVPLRYGRMLRTPFTFCLGEAYLMAADLAGTPRTDLTVQLCGPAGDGGVSSR